MKRTYLTTGLLVLILFSGSCLQAQTDDHERNRVQCERLLGMAQNLILPATMQDIDYTSGFKAESGQEEAFVAFFFASLRTPQIREVAIRQFEQAPLDTKIQLLHRLSYAMGLTIFNLTQLMNLEHPYFPGQEDADILTLLQIRAELIINDLLPNLFISPPDSIVPYFDDLTAIGADFANVPVAYGASVSLIEFLEPLYEMYKARGGTRISPSMLAMTKFHAFANLALEEPDFDRAKLKRALNDVIQQLKQVDSPAPYSWLLCQLAYRMDIGITVKDSSVFPTVKWTTRLLLDQLPEDFLFLRESHPLHLQAYQQGAADLLFALGRIPTLLDAPHTRKLRALAGIESGELR